MLCTLSTMPVWMEVDIVDFGVAIVALEAVRHFRSTMPHTRFKMYRAGLVRV